MLFVVLEIQFIGSVAHLLPILLINHKIMPPPHTLKGLKTCRATSRPFLIGISISGALLKLYYIKASDISVNIMFGSLWTGLDLLVFEPRVEPADKKEASDERDDVGW